MFKKMNTRVGRASVILVVAVACIIAIVVSGCTTPQYNDLRNTGSSYPDYAQTFINVDGFPNITMLCIKGVGFGTTSRDLDAAFLVPGWNSFCATQVGHHAR